MAVYSPKRPSRATRILTNLACTLAGTAIVGGMAWFSLQMILPAVEQWSETFVVDSYQTNTDDQSDHRSPDTKQQPDSEVYPSNDQEQEAPAIDTTKQSDDIGYYYEQLDDNDKQLYLELLTAMQNYETEFDLSGYETMSMDDLFLIYQGVLLDHPELFWMSNYASCTYYEEGNTELLTSLEMPMLLTKEEVKLYNQQIEQVVRPVVTEASQLKSDYDKAIYLYEYLIDHCCYDNETAMIVGQEESITEFCPGNSMVGALLDGKSICTGYSRAYHYLLEQLSIDAFSVVGLGDGIPHEWNITELDGAYYHVDLTWGDPMMLSGEDWLSYEYFGLTTEEILRDHSFIKDFTYPVCDALVYNYYRYNQRLFEDYDYPAVQAIVQQAVDQNRTFVEMKFTTTEAYDSATNALLEQGDYFRLIDAHGEVLQPEYRYDLNDEGKIITLVLSYQE